jgi:phage terminase large subunit
MTMALDPSLKATPIPEVWTPPDVQAIARQRMARIKKMVDDPAYARAANQVYAGNVLAWIDDWAVTYDPRIDPPMMPFVMFERQRELVTWIGERDKAREDGLVDKSRDTGVTWLCVCYAVWMFLYRPGAKISFGSRKESLVDDIGDPDSILEKARMLLKAMPTPLMPEGLRLNRDLGFLKLVNRTNGATITGEAGNNIGRGGRSTIYFVDEAAFLERPDRVEAALSANSNCKIYVSTPNGPGNPFFRRRHGGRVKHFTLHWTQDPRKDEAWRKEMQDSLEPWMFAQEVEIDYHASLSDVAIPSAWVVAAQEIRNYMWIPPGSIGIGGLDVAASGGAKCVFIARFGPVVLQPMMWEGVDTTVTAMNAVELARQRKIQRLNYDVVGVGHGVSAGLHGIEDIGIFPVNAGDQPTSAVWPDGKRSKEKFGNLKAELWWRARDRFEKTHSTLLSLRGDEKSKKYPAEDLIALPPGHYPLLNEISSVRAFRNQQGKIIMESKKQLHSRGVSSPDHAEALILSLAPPARIAYASSYHV